MRVVRGSCGAFLFAVVMACTAGLAWAQTSTVEVSDVDIRVGGPPIEVGLNTGHLPLRPGVPVTLMVAYRNTGAAAASETVWLEVEGVRVAEATVSLAPGTRKEVEFTRTFDRPGVYEAQICTLSACEEFMIGVASPDFLRTLSETESNVSSIAFSPDGKLLASAADLSGNVSVVNLWDVASGTVSSTLPGSKGYDFFSVAFSPNGRTLAAGSGDKTVKLWDVGAGTLLRTLSGHEDWIRCVAFSPDGGTVDVASGADNIVKLWDVATGTLVREFYGHASDTIVCYRVVTSVAFSPDGKLLAAGSGDSTVALWNVSTGSCRRLRHKEAVSCVAFSPDSKTLASGSSDETIRLWDVATGTRLGILSGHEDWVSSIAFSPDGKTLASGSRDLTIRLWNVVTGAQLHTLTGHLGDDVRCVAFSPDGSLLASCASDWTIML